MVPTAGAQAAAALLGGSSGVTRTILETELFGDLPCPAPHGVGTFLLYTLVTFWHGAILFTWTNTPGRRRRRHTGLLAWGAGSPDFLTRLGWTFASIYALWIGWQAGWWWAALLSWDLGAVMASDTTSLWAWLSHVGILLSRVSILVTVIAFWAASIIVAFTRLATAWLPEAWISALDDDSDEDDEDEYEQDIDLEKGVTITPMMNYEEPAEKEGNLINL
jgi:hypothetical protein